VFDDSTQTRFTFQHQRLHEKELMCLTAGLILLNYKHILL